MPTSRSFAVLGVATAGGSNIIKSSYQGLLKIAKLAHTHQLLGHGFHSAIEVASTGITNIVRHNILSPGDLHEIKITLRGWEGADLIPRELQAMQTIADTFRSGTYLSYTTAAPRTTLYRLASATPETLDTMTNIKTTTAHMGAYWTRSPILSPTMGMIDGALERSWGNKANVWVRIEVPAGEQLFEGVAASIQRIGTNMSEFVGGGNQVYIPGHVPTEWLKEVGSFQ